MQSYPKSGGKPTDSTQVRVLYDNDALYVGVRMFDSDPKGIAAQLARRDATGIYSDWLHLHDRDVSRPSHRVQVLGEPAR